jgi:hypothetical protein
MEAGSAGYSIVTTTSGARRDKCFEIQPAGSFVGEMILPGGKVIAPTGKAFDLDFATIARWDGDLLVEEFVFWDSALHAQQLGIG